MYIFLESSKFRVPVGIFTLYITGIAGGGGGSCSGATLFNGAGGSSGEFVINYALNIDPRHYLYIEIGTGGAGLPAGSASGSQASAGTDTVIYDISNSSTDIFHLYGGNGAIYNSTNSIAGSSATGTGAGNGVVSPGNYSGMGGGWLLGGHGSCISSTSAGTNGVNNTGAGGGGSAMGASSAGGAGGSGILFISLR